MKEPRLSGAACACLFTLFSMSSEAAIIGFDSLEVANSSFNFIGSGIYSEDNFTITVTAAPMTFAGMYYAGQNYTGYYAGSAGLGPQGPGAITTLQHSAGNVFSIDSIGLSIFEVPIPSTHGPVDVPVTFTGYLSGGGTPVTQSFQLSSFGFSDFFFNSSFTNLTSLTWNQGMVPADSYQFDNIVVSAVPIPAAVWLFGSGLLGLTGIARRKKA